MSEATDFRDNISNLIDENGSTVIITPRALAEGSNGGYGPGTDTFGTVVTTKGIPSEFLKTKSGQPSGKLQEGEVVIVLKYDETVLKDYKISYQSNDFTIQEIKAIIMQDITIGLRVKLSKVLD